MGDLAELLRDAFSAIVEAFRAFVKAVVRWVRQLWEGVMSPIAGEEILAGQVVYFDRESDTFKRYRLGSPHTPYGVTLHAAARGMEVRLIREVETVNHGKNIPAFSGRGQHSTLTLNGHTYTLKDWTVEYNRQPEDRPQDTRVKITAQTLGDDMPLLDFNDRPWDPRPQPLYTIRFPHPYTQAVRDEYSLKDLTHTPRSHLSQVRDEPPADPPSAWREVCIAAVVAVALAAVAVLWGFVWN